MNVKNLRNLLLLFVIGIASLATAQQKQQPMPMEDIEISPFDFGKMWTFENLPLDYFEKTYGFRPTEQWIESARMASLRFATWCSASFVSPNGLIMTNHHCSESVVIALQKEGESFGNNGFIAKSLEEERKADGLFVEQMVKVADITAAVKKYTNAAANDQELMQKRQEAFTAVQEEYGKKAGWENLRLQPVTFYSGEKFSLYGYKRYDDIRLVLLPEAQIGFYGGDPDNFTYPRYNIDCTFWRAYDENGKPLDTSKNYFKFKEAGAEEGEAVFVIGNPGSTERYRTVAQLEFDRDYRYPVQLKSMKNSYNQMQAEYDKNPSEELASNMFSISNGIKAIGGIQEGLENPVLFGRKVKMEQKIRAANPGLDVWDQLAKSYGELGKLLPAYFLLGYNPSRPNPNAAKSLALIHMLHGYEADLQNEETKEEDLEKVREDIKKTALALDSPEERAKLALLLSDYDRFSPDHVLKGMDAAKYVDNMFAQSKLMDEKGVKKILKAKAKKLAKTDDPFIHFARTLVPRHNKAVESFVSTGPTRRALEGKVANAVFNVYGSDLPPDATFTLRMADGVVKGYNYNGTRAPYKTTFFGMYDRHYSNNGKFPWSLPKAWENPPMELLKSPINLVSTNDIIGGNSGSPMINKNLEAVGLIFDGNIESLPGNFIYEEEFNRTVSVHAGGIAAALKYIYKADRLYKELTGN